MKSFFVLAAVAVATVNAADCNLAALIPLLSNPNVQACTAETGFQPPIPPTPDMYPRVCVASCRAALQALEGLGMGDCTIRGIGLETNLANPVKQQCGWGAAAAPAPAAATPAAATPAAATPTTQAPAAGTPTAQGTPAASTPAASSKPVC